MGEARRNFLPQARPNLTRIELKQIARKQSKYFGSDRVGLETGIRVGARFRPISYIHLILYSIYILYLSSKVITAHAHLYSHINFVLKNIKVLRAVLVDFCLVFSFLSMAADLFKICIFIYIFRLCSAM